MDLKQYVRDGKRVQSHLKEMADGSVVTTRGCKIYIPSRFRDKHLAEIGNETYILGVFMMTVEDGFYAVNNVNAMIPIEPTSVNNVIIENKDYLEFIFEAGDTVFPTTDVVQTNKLVYYIFDEIVAKGNVPVYMDYNDLCNLFKTSQQFAGVRLASTPTIMHMLLSKIARDPKDPSIYFRQVTNGRDSGKVRYISLRSTTHGATNTTARLLGSYFSDNVTSALVNPSERNENVESILRS